MKHFSLPIFCAFILGFGLPLHGAISVFLPQWFRWWKELLFLYFFIAGLYRFYETHRWNIQKIKKPVVCALLLLTWGGIRFLFEPSLGFYGIISLRFLLFGYATYVVFSLLEFHPKKESIQSYFSGGLIIGTLCGVLFGFWAHFFGGYEILAHFYSTTISSWVPGQTLPLYHEANGFPRMQGMSSGPVAFAHIILAALMSLRFVKIKPASRVVLWTLFTVAIYESQSRAAMLLLMFLVCWEVSAFLILQKSVNFIRFLVFSGAMFFSLILALAFTSVPQKILDRAGTSDHFTKPIEAIQIGLNQPFIGHLSTIGPAARIKNLAQINNDYALLAENVLVDIFAQLGFIGLVLALFFWGSVFFSIHKHHIVVPFIVLGGGMLASLYDMIPVAIALFVVLAFSPQKVHCEPDTKTNIS